MYFSLISILTRRDLAILLSKRAPAGAVSRQWVALRAICPRIEAGPCPSTLSFEEVVFKEVLPTIQEQMDQLFLMMLTFVFVVQLTYQISVNQKQGPTKIQSNDEVVKFSTNHSLALNARKISHRQSKLGK